MEYKNTLRLPTTAFPMKADLPKREPQLLALWEKENLYSKIISSRKDRPQFLLHDGPPFANGDAHMGHALNMTLKDIVLKSKTMAGFCTPFVPGWDCHGLPIEHKVMQEIEKEAKKDASVKRDSADIRIRCEAYARKYIHLQREQFKRLGVFGEWENPYLTLDPVYESDVLRSLATLIEKNLVYQGMRPVYWSTGCQTALAEAEVEYQDRTDTSVYVAFPLTAESIEKLGLPKGADASILIWTTTPWTLPANLAVAAHEKINYVVAELDGKYYVFSGHLMSAIQKIGITTATTGKEFKVLELFAGKKLVGLQYQHPLVDRKGTIYPAEFVTEDSGTGLVHIAPGHGHDDFQLGQKYNIGLLSPVDANGKLTEECGIPEVTGMFVFKANHVIVDLLKNKGVLWASEEYSHSYPHCWRSKTPIIFRCVKQWFINVNAIREKAIKEIDAVNWIPSWGINRIRGAVETRPDWCISRQRTWGVPIPVFYREDGKALLDAAIVRKFADIVEKEGTNVWFSEADDTLAARLGLPGGLKKGLDTLDVWIDSGSSHVAVLKRRQSFPADLYLEGSDQHRGWFQSSLLLSVAVNDAAPYRNVLTNGFVVDVDGKKLSKSNTYQKPAGLMEFVNQFGGDILRLWVASQDYRDDVPFSDEIFKRVIDTYRLFRNTFRVLLGNLNEFDPKADAVPESQWTELDLYVVNKLQDVIRVCTKAYEDYEFHQVYHSVNRFCAVELSALYVDVLKDRMYCDAKSSVRRRASQTAIHEILGTLCKLLAPITPFTAEETWQFLADPKWEGKALTRESVHLAEFPKARVVGVPETFGVRWEKILALRVSANEKLEPMRQAKQIGKSLEAKLVIKTPDFTSADAPVLEEVLLVSKVELLPAEKGATVEVTGSVSDGKKCPRCWKYVDDAGKDPEHPDLCPRCTEAVKSL